MPGTEYAEDCMPVLTLSEGLELNTQLFLEMQIKKMKEIIPQLYTDQVNDRNNSLTTSPKQLSSEYVSQPNGNEAQPHGHQDTKAEDDKTSMVTCVRCRSVQKIPLQELKKDNQHSQSEDQMFFVCVKCNQGLSPPFPCMNDIPSAIDSGNKDNTISRTITNQFKVKNFQPGKYYCDKCRFSTKDPLQYKKHTLLHEEIKFFCSHCSYVSYTKGEFQRHLVKHTGTFPYRCEYCDYGAVRNDYIVKHTRRVHETGGEKRPLKQAGEHQPKRTSFSKQNSEVLVNEVSKSNSFLNEPSDLSFCFPGHGDQDKAGHAISLPESKECSKVEAASAPDKACFSEPSKVNLFENENVEVELLSPAKEPVQPGMPLTVVAPADLRVPDNCLAQLIDIKVVNGTQQLVLKLIPLKEKNGIKPGSSGEGKYEFVNKSTVPNEQEKLVPIEQTSPAMERSPEKPLSIRNLHFTDYTHVNDLDCRKVSVPQVLKDKSETNQSRCESCPSSDRIGNWRQEVLSVPYRTVLSPISSRDGDIKQNNYFSSVSVMNNGALCSPVKRSGVLPHIPALSPHQDKAQNRLEKPPSECKPAEAVRAFAERGMLPVSPGSSLQRNEVGTFKMVTFSEKLKQTQVKEPPDDPNPIQDSVLHSEQSHINLISGNDIKTQDPEEVMQEDLVGVTIQNSGSNITSSDGPIISSVFSLSSGAENIPEGIHWDNISCRTKSVSSLHRKIAQLIATPESSDSSLSPLSVVEQHSSPLKTPIDCVLGHNAPSHAPVLPQGLQNNAADNEQFTFEQMQQQDRKSSLSPLSIVKQHSSPLKTPIDCVLGHNAPSHAPVLPQGLRNNAADNEQFTFEQMQQQDRKSSLSPLSIVKQQSSPLKTPIDCVLGHNAPSHAPVLPQGLRNNAADNEQFTFEQMQQQDRKSSLSPLSIVKQQSSPLKTPIDCVLGHNAPSHAPVLPQGLRNNAADNEQFTFEQMQQQDRKSSLSPLSIVKQHSSPLKTPIDCVLGHNAPSHNPVQPQGLWNNAADNKQFTFEQMQQHDRKSSLSPLSIVKQHSSPLKTPIDCVLGHNARSHDPVLPQRLQDNAADNKQFTFEQMQQQNSMEEQTKARETRKNPDTPPVFIPKETVLKAFNSTEKEHLVENKLPCDMFGNERLLPKSVSFNSLEQVGEDFSLTNESRSTDSSRNLGISLENKTNQEFATSTVSNITNSVCSQPEECSDQDEEGKLIFGGPSGSKIKMKQAVMSKKKSKTQSESSHLLPDVCIYMTSRHLRLMPVRKEQLIKCPRRNQPVVVLNHPDVDSIEVINVMKVVNKYKGSVLKVVLSERTCDQLGIKRHHRRLIYQNMEAVFPVKKQTMLKMKLKKIHKNSYEVVDSLPGESVQGMFKCWFCGRIYEDQEEWMSHGQRHLIEATRDWEQLSPPLGVPR